MNPKKIAIVFGTRPDTIKMAPLILEFQNYPEYFKVITIATAQHRQMLDQVLDVFKIKPDYDLDIMSSKQTLATLTARIITGIDEILEIEKPDMVLVQGDTSTTCIASLAAFYRQIPVGHVEAGLRTNDKANPFPEEINRRITGCITDLHFAPTETARQALLKENTDPKNIFVTGNTVVDALKYSVVDNFQFTIPELTKIVDQKKKIILVTMHRRENWGKPMEGACKAVKRLAEKHPDFAVVFPVHLNPIVREVVYPILKDLPNVHLIEPLDYLDFVNLMAKSYMILTDSGGVQEEGPHFGVPILVLRYVTERPDAIDFGTVKLVGLDEETIYSTALQLIEDKAEYTKMSNAVNPYGDGLSSLRSIKIIMNYFGFTNETVEEFHPR
ncbi:MAG: UDP-N-acetylglucosamine 2-epimerase (non-hydrolyzing) [Bacteroidales bacterium]|nr:UDP-N-acetylglucosamine 2-epimerase (non-hydrolyzing) [Bacteroidales bacterium]